VNCADVPFATLGLGGVTSIDSNKAGVTASLVFPTTRALLAEMVVAPVLSAVASPFAAPESLMVAAAGLDELQATWAVMSLWVLSLITAVAVSCLFIPAATCGLAGVISIDFTVGVRLPNGSALPLPPPPPEHPARTPRNPQIRARASHGAALCEAVQVRSIFLTLPELLFEGPSIGSSPL